MNNQAVCNLLHEVAGSGKGEITHEEADAHEKYLDSLNARINKYLQREINHLAAIRKLRSVVKKQNKCIASLLSIPGGK